MGDRAQDIANIVQEAVEDNQVGEQAAVQEQPGEAQPAGEQAGAQAVQEEPNRVALVNELKTRIEVLENNQNASVDAILTQIKGLVASKSLLFNKDYALDSLLQLKILAKEAKHPKAAFYSAVLEALRDKMSAPDDQFKKYISVLLGDKDQEKVLEAISKVDKASKAAAPKPFSSSGGQSGSNLVTRRRYERPFGIRCFNCKRMGHFQNQCPERREGGSYGPPLKKPRRPENA